MQIIGYISYGLLIFLAFVWTFGVRVNLGAGVHSVLGALFFMASAIVLGVFGLPKIHSLWLLPSGFVFIMWICPLIIAYEIPLIGSILKFFGSVYAHGVFIWHGD
jgi:hypothetical protein